MNSISLSELTDRIQQIIKLNFDQPVWIKAEISEIRENSNGHCYLEFVEKTDDYITAKCKATIWSTTYRMLKPYFESSTGEVLQAGLKVLVAVTVDFHSVYGLSLNVKDIDPTFTIGEVAAQRLKIIKKLEEDGIADMNKLLDFPVLTQRIAVISSPTAAGYGDFMDQLNNDGHHYSLYIKLFPAIMQGDKAESSIIEALEKIYANIELFDAVVLIRGGGATADLACFDSYELALNCAQFPIPIIAGIGHQRDISILDMIANTSVKTPTAAAEFLIDRMTRAENRSFEIVQDIYNLFKNKTREESVFIADMRWKIRQSLQQKINTGKMQQTRYAGRLRSAIKHNVSRNMNMLLLLEKNIEAHSPSFLLKHGYTITTLNGKRVSTVEMLQKGDVIRTFVPDGDFESQII